MTRMKACPICGLGAVYEHAGVEKIRRHSPLSGNPRSYCRGSGMTLEEAVRLLWENA